MRKCISKLAVGAWLLSMSTSVAFGNTTEFGYWTTYSKGQNIYATKSNNNSNGTETITISCVNDKLQAEIKYIGGDKNIREGDVEVWAHSAPRSSIKSVKLPGHLKGDYITITSITKDFIALFKSEYRYIEDDLSYCGTNDKCLDRARKTETEKRKRASYDHVNLTTIGNVNTISPVFKAYGASEAIEQVIKTCPNGFVANTTEEMNNYTTRTGNSIFFDGSEWHVHEEVDKFTGERKVSATYNWRSKSATADNPHVEVSCIDGKKLNALFYIHDRQWQGNVYNKEAKSKVEIIAVSEGHKPVKTTKWKANGNEVTNEYVTKEFLDILQSDKYKYTDYLKMKPAGIWDREHIAVEFK
jgi:hypothetical protein